MGSTMMLSLSFVLSSVIFANGGRQPICSEHVVRDQQIKIVQSLRAVFNEYVFSDSEQNRSVESFFSLLDQLIAANAVSLQFIEKLHTELRGEGASIWNLKKNFTFAIADRVSALADIEGIGPSKALNAPNADSTWGQRFGFYGKRMTDPLGEKEFFEGLKHVFEHSDNKGYHFVVSGGPDADFDNTVWSLDEKGKVLGVIFVQDYKENGDAPRSDLLVSHIAIHGRAPANTLVVLLNKLRELAERKNALGIYISMSSRELSQLASKEWTNLLKDHGFEFDGASYCHAQAKNLK